MVGRLINLKGLKVSGRATFFSLNPPKRLTNANDSIKGVGSEAMAICCGHMCKLGGVGFRQLKKFVIG